MAGASREIIQFPRPKGESTSHASWEDVRDDYRLYLTTRHTSKDTARTYHHNVSLFARWCEHEGVSLIDADRADVTRWFSWEADRSSRADYTPRTS